MPPIPPPRLGTSLALLAASEVRRAIRCLGDTSNRHRGIHETRKALRRLKSLLRLGTEPFGDALAPVEAVIDRLARGLSPLRDAHVAVNTARSLAGAEPSAAWQEAINTLELRSEGRLVAALIKDPRFLKRRKLLRELGHRVDVLPWRKIGRATVERAVDRSGKRVAKARKRLRNDSTPANLHRWRRRARRLRMQLELARKARKLAGITSHQHAHRDKTLARQMSTLSDAIGARQDLRMLRAALRSVMAADALPALLADATSALKAHHLPPD